jgi:hypothetical protein
MCSVRTVADIPLLISPTGDFAIGWKENAEHKDGLPLCCEEDLNANPDHMPVLRADI